MLPNLLRRAHAGDRRGRRAGQPRSSCRCLIVAWAHRRQRGLSRAAGGRRWRPVRLLDHRGAAVGPQGLPRRRDGLVPRSGTSYRSSRRCALRPFGLSGLLAGFLVGQIAAAVPDAGAGRRALTRASRWCRSSSSTGGAPTSALSATGLLYNLGIWIDKLIFWFTPSTSEPVLGPLRASIIYDLPIFLAYLSIVPGMAVFLVRVETDFAEAVRRASSTRSATARRSARSAAAAIG